MTTDTRGARTRRDDDFHEIQLTGKQLVFLFMATTAVSIVIFLCGVLVGRGVRLSATGDSSSVVALAPVPDSFQGDVPVADTTADAAAPMDGAMAPDSPPADRPAPGEEAPDVPGSRYYEELMTDQPPARLLDSASGRSPPEGPEPALAMAASTPPAPPEGWAVQVTALRQREAAEAVATRLVGRGYPVFVLDPQPESTPLFRVRVGPFVERSEAEAAMRRLTEEEQFNPWIAR